MKKSLSVLVVLSVVAALSTAAVAQTPDSVLWFDIRDNSAGLRDITGTPAQPFTNGQEHLVPATNLALPGGPGDGQILRINPDCTNDYEIDSSVGNFTRYPDLDGDGDLKTASLWLYMDVNVNSPAGTNEVISSIGLDMDIELAGGGVPVSGEIASINYAWTGTGFSDSNAGFAHGATTATNPPDWEDAKAVKVPVITGPLYAVGTGLTPGGPYQIGRLDVVGGARGALPNPTHAADSTYELHLVVDSLLITRVFETGGDTQEDVSFGYAAGLPETPTVNGSSAGASSTAPDAIIKVRVKGDSNGDGAVDGADIGAGPNSFKDVIGYLLPLAQEKVYLHDFDNTQAVDGGDIGGFKTALAMADTGGC